jgi:hypothetical protein
MKRRRLAHVAEQAKPIARRLAADREALMLMAAALYLGEGARASNAFMFGNSDARLVCARLSILRKVVGIDEAKLRCQLMFTAGMDEAALTAYWAEKTGVPVRQLMHSRVRLDAGGRKRTGDLGVCAVYYHSLEVRRWLDAIGAASLTN